MAEFQLGGFVLDAQIWERNLSVYKLKTVPFGDFGLPVWIVLSLSKQCQVAIQILFQFVIENDAERPGSGVLDPRRLFLIEAIQISIVLRFSGLQQGEVPVWAKTGEARIKAAGMTAQFRATDLS